MKQNEFIQQVQDAAQLNLREEAEKAIRATLETLKERIVGNEASQLAAQLPPEIGQYLQGREGGNGEHFPLIEFYKRVSEKADVEPSAATIQARAVFSVIQEAVTPGEFADVRANLSEDYLDLFPTPSSKPVS